MESKEPMNVFDLGKLPGQQSMLIFHQLIWKKDNSIFPKAIDEIYPWFSEAPVETYRKFGIEAEFQVVNDIITTTRKKIAGEGGGNIGDCMVFVGGILLDFDYQPMG